MCETFDVNIIPDHLSSLMVFNRIRAAQF